MMKDLGAWSDYHIDPPEEKIVGYDWKGDELYGHEIGFIIDGEFVRKEEAMEYLMDIYVQVTSGDVLGGY